MTATSLDRTFAALADRHRRAVIELLRRRPRRAGELARALDLSAPAMSRHLRLLRQAGLVDDNGVDDDARVKLYRLRQRPFTSLKRWVQVVEGIWTDPATRRR